MILKAATGYLMEVYDILDSMITLIFDEFCCYFADTDMAE